MSHGTSTLVTYAALAFAMFIGPCLVLLAIHLVAKLSRKRGTWRKSPQSIATPLGYRSYWTEETRKLATPGIERARTREYCNPRGDK